MRLSYEDWQPKEHKKRKGRNTKSTNQPRIFFVLFALVLRFLCSQCPNLTSLAFRRKRLAPRNGSVAGACGLKAGLRTAIFILLRRRPLRHERLLRKSTTKI